MSPSGPDRAFVLDDASVAFEGRAALAGVHLDIAPGERVGLVGPSGAGKTTLLRLLAASMAPDRGTACVLGQQVNELQERALCDLRSRVGFVHQDHALTPNLRVLQNVLAGALGRRGFWGGLRDLVWPRRADVETVHELLERVGIEEKLFDRADTLSGGQQQRVAIARALFQEPDALLADEPVASVDPARAEAVVQLLVEVAREQELTLVCSLHDIELARRSFSRLVGVREGRIAFDGPTASITEEQLTSLYALDGIGAVEA